MTMIDTKTLTAQENRARDVITGGQAARMPRFVKTAKNGFVLDEAALARHPLLHLHLDHGRPHLVHGLSDQKAMVGKLRC